MTANSPKPRFVILSTHRSGTTLLRGMLNAHPGLICRSEIFCWDYGFWDFDELKEDEAAFAACRAMHEDDAAGFIEKYGLAPVTDDTVSVGFTLMYSQVVTRDPESVWQWLWGHPEVKVIHLERRDHLLRYLSWERARRSKEWIRLKKDVDEVEAPALELEVTSFVDYVAGLGEQRDRALEGLARHSVLRLAYEELDATPSEALERAFAFLGVEPVEAEPKTRRQRDSDDVRDLIANYDEVCRTVLPERVTGGTGDDRRRVALRGALLDTHFSEFRGWFVPWVRRHATDVAASTAVEIGCRRGELTAALALAFARVEAYEADGPDLEFARSRMRLLDLDNVEFRRHGPLDRLARIRGDHPPGSVDCAILFGVLQRLDGAGRLDTLRTAWEVVRPGGLIVIASTPNQGVTGAPARPAGAGGLPDAVVGGGGGTSYGEFVAALGVVDPAIAGDGFDPEPLRQFGVSAATRTRCLAGEPNRVPPAFLRESVDVILRKPDGDHRNPIADRNLRDIIGRSTEAGLAVTGTAVPMNRRGAPP